MSDEENETGRDCAPRPRSPCRGYRLRDEEVAAAVDSLPGTQLHASLKHDLALWRRQGCDFEAAQRFTRPIAARMCDGSEDEEAIAKDLTHAMLRECRHRIHAHRWVDGFSDGEYDDSGKSFGDLLLVACRKVRRDSRDRRHDERRLAKAHLHDMEHAFDAYWCREEGRPDRRLHLQQQFKQSLEDLERHRRFKPVHRRVVEAIVRGEDLAGIARYVHKSQASVTRYMHQIHSMLPPQGPQPDGGLRVSGKRHPR